MLSPNYRYRQNKHGHIDLQLCQSPHRNIVFIELRKKRFISRRACIIMPLIIFCLILLSHFCRSLPGCATSAISRRNLLLQLWRDGMQNFREKRITRRSFGRTVEITIMASKPEEVSARASLFVDTVILQWPVTLFRALPGRYGLLIQHA